MKWFRSNIRLGSRLALLALAIQFLLVFGHFHGSSAQAAHASIDAQQSRFDGAVHFAASHVDLLDRASHANASGQGRLQTSSDHAPAGEPADDCAICAIMALASAMVVATPPYLLGPQASAFSYLTTDTEFAALNSARAAFQPRAPPIS
jgi:hypothetical protein